jgi:hypothetical protein
MEHGIVFARVRERAVRGEDPSLAYFGWSPAFEKAVGCVAFAAADPETWAQANPALGIRISPEHVAKEHRSMDPRTFAVERLGVGDWPRVSDEDGAVISVKAWLSLMDPTSVRRWTRWCSCSTSARTGRALLWRSPASVMTACRMLRLWSTSAGPAGWSTGSSRSRVASAVSGPV